MIARRTSSKISIVAGIFFLLYFFAAWAAEKSYVKTSPISFGLHEGRPWNPWDYVSYGSLLMFISLLVASLMFLSKDD